MSKRSNVSSLVLPLVVVTTLLNIPGMVDEGLRARLVFMAVGVLAWVVAEIYDRRSETIIGTILDVSSYAISVFVSEGMRRTRVCVSLTIAICTAYSITKGGHWINSAPPFPIAPLFLISAIWAAIELFLITLAAVEDWQIKHQRETSEPYEERVW